jgi:hypothetical protein
MSSETTAASVAVLRDAYPRQEFPDRSVRLYVRMLSDLDPTSLVAAVERLINRQAFLPAISEIRMEVAEAECGLPTPAEAWSLVTSLDNEYARDSLPNVVRLSLDAMGGRWSIVRSEKPETVRAQFMRDYEQRRARQLLVHSGAATRAAIVEGINDGTATAIKSGIPESDAIQPRPVWARWLRRQQWMMPPVQDAFQSPTDAEKHDAIAVLEAEGWGVEMLWQEAQRILDEASAA